MPVRLRLSITPSVATGCIPRARATIGDLRIAGLHLASIDVRARHLQVVAQWPPRLRAERLVVRVHVEQDALDRWTRSSGLPLRLALRDGAINARTGIAGYRLGELDIALHIDRGRLRLAPRRVRMLGVTINAASAPMPPVTLPLPPLPRQATLVAVDPADGAIDVALELPRVDEALTPDRIRWLVGALRGRTDPGAITTTHHRPWPPMPAVTGSATSRDRPVVAGSMPAR